MYSNLSGPTKAVCYREVFAIRGELVKRGSPAFNHNSVRASKGVVGGKIGWKGTPTICKDVHGSGCRIGGFGTTFISFTRR